MGIRSWKASLAVAVVALGAGAPNASAETINTDVPVSGMVVSCTGEEVFIDGTMHVKATGSTSLNGTKSQIEMNLTGVKGTTVTGVRYVLNQQVSDMQHAEFDAFGNVQATYEQTDILTRQGETSLFPVGDDLRLHWVVHLTMNSQGVPTSQKNDLRSECR
jgi:hypothetical protein